MRIGITGAHGFVGSHLVQALERGGEHQLRLLDRKTHSLFAIQKLRPFVAGLDLLFHLAGANRASNQELFRVNAMGTLNLVEALNRYGEGQPRLVFLSSFQVYKPSENDGPVDESWPTAPTTIYGISKLAAEGVILASGLGGIIFRASNIYGPGCRPFYNSVLSTFAYQAAKGQPITVSGTGEQRRDFLYVGDVVAALISSLGYQSKGCEVINICSGTLVSLKEVIEILTGLCTDLQLSHMPAPADSRQDQGWRGDYSNAKKLLGWTPQVPLAQGLKETLYWFRHHYQG